MIEPFESPGVRGYLHHPSEATGEGLVLAHGAGSDCKAPLLVAVAAAFSGAGFAVLRIDLPFRTSGRKGPPVPAVAGKDREGLCAALDALSRIAKGPLCLGGHSYGGRQSTMLAAEAPDLPAAALLLLSYPLHPPDKPAQLRTEHLPRLRTPALFVHGTKDPFGAEQEMRDALRLIPAPADLLLIDGAGHDLRRCRDWSPLPPRLRAITSARSQP